MTEPDTTIRRQIPAEFVVEELTYAENLIRFSSFQPWLDGTQPYLVEDRIERSVAAREVVPDNFEIERVVTTKDTLALVARSDKSTLGMEVGIRYTEFRVTGTTQELADTVACDLRHRATGDTDATKVPARVWNCSHAGSYDDRQLTATPWSEIEGNYALEVRGQLAALMVMPAPELDSPRLVVWHGEPGTGKTTALRSLAMEWRKWASFQYISDAAAFFQNPEYFDSVLDTAPREPKGPTLSTASKLDETWQLIVAEDTDEFLRPNSSTSASTALGKLLNLSDGILGQHHRVIVLLTTNEEINRLHPALVRPGRCLAETEFTRFGTTEANQWLDGKARVTRPASLAELLAKRGDIKAGSTHPNTYHSIGAYL